MIRRYSFVVVVVVTLCCLQTILDFFTHAHIILLIFEAIPKINV